MGASLDAIWAEVQRINTKLDDLPGIIELSAGQIHIVVLDELSENFGLIRAGEFRTGNNQAPGDSFSGMRIGFPPFQYPDTSTASSDGYNLAGVDADTLMIGIGASDGVLYAGRGAVTLDQSGITLRTGALSGNRLDWDDSDGVLRGFINVTEVSGVPSRPRMNITLQPDTLSTDDGSITMSVENTANDESGIQIDHSVDSTLQLVNLFVGNATTIKLGAFEGGLVLGGVGSTSTLLLAVLNESALTFNSTASGGIETPDNEALKLWVDTAGELRMRDSDGTDWYITKNNDTGST